jgi:hypothetical protein
MTSATMARAQRPPEPPPPEPARPEPATLETSPAIPEDLAGRLEELEAETRKLERLARDGARAREQVAAMSWLPRYITAFIDVGAFAVGGNGSGIRSDSLHIHYPRYRNTVSGQWVFMGDPFSTAINSLGEPADTSSSRENTHDTIHSQGRPSLIVNALGLGISKTIAGGVSISALAELLPRPGPDHIDVPLAHIDYRPSDDIDLVISAGKIDSVLGVEYRVQDAPRRPGVTPSLICRYTCGRPLGIEARLVRGRLSTSAAITNGDSFDERFAPDDELKANQLPTVSGHVQWMLPLGQGLELGVSGMVGPQDRQPSLSVHQWHYGLDAKLRDLRHWNIAAELVQGRQQGRTSGDPARDRMLGIERPSCDLAQCLSYKGAYVLVDRRVNTWLTPYIRIDWRDAVLERGADFVYESHTLRTTTGVHLEITSRIVGKIEYTWIHELEVPQFPHDVITSSIVVSTD